MPVTAAPATVPAVGPPPAAVAVWPRLLGRELALGWGGGGEPALAAGFFLLVVTLFPLTIGPDRDTLMRVGPGVLWVAVVLAGLLTLERLVRSDFEEGGLEQVLALGASPLAVVLAKTVAHWLLTGLPLVVLSPLALAMLGVPWAAWAVALVALLPGTAALSLTGMAGAMLLVGARRGGVLLALLSLPLALPVAIFGAGAVHRAAAPVVAGEGPAGAVLLLAALMCATAVIAPAAATAALRQAVR